MIAILDIDEKFDRHRLKSIARAQRHLCYCILFFFVLWVGCVVLFTLLLILNNGPGFIASMSNAAIGGWFALFISVATAMQVYALVCTYKLARVRFGSLVTAILLTIAVAVMPFFGVLLLIGINISATSVLKKAGVKIGLLGAKMSQFDS